jgi:predicted Zn-dependent protease
MPGGKVVVYTGLLPVTQDEAGLAVVMGHEIAHAIARHGNERMSQGMLVQLGGLALAVAVSQKPEATQNIFLQSYGITSTLGVLKYSRTHESEADKMGLVFSAIAGYDPNVAVSFWERMAAAGGQQPLELLSTHPSDETRINDIKEFLPEAMKYYKKKK